MTGKYIIHFKEYYAMLQVMWQTFIYILHSQRVKDLLHELLFFHNFIFKCLCLMHHNVNYFQSETEESDSYNLP